MQQKEPSQKDVAASIAPLNARIKELKDFIKRKTEEIQDLTNKLHRKSNISINLEKDDPKTPSGIFRLGFDGQRDSRYNLSQGLIKCNWEEFEKKISLVDENDYQWEVG